MYVGLSHHRRRGDFFPGHLHRKQNARSRNEAFGRVQGRRFLRRPRHVHQEQQWQGHVGRTTPLGNPYLACWTPATPPLAVERISMKYSCFCSIKEPAVPCFFTDGIDPRVIPRMSRPSPPSRYCPAAPPRPQALSSWPRFRVLVNPSVESIAQAVQHGHILLGSRRTLRRPNSSSVLRIMPRSPLILAIFLRTCRVMTPLLFVLLGPGPSSRQPSVHSLIKPPAFRRGSRCRRSLTWPRT